MMQLSIVIPTLNEAAIIEPTLRRLAEVAPAAERIVVDGGSTDGTAGLATPHARVVAAERGRARQMNQGAAEAAGEWLLFLHADTRPSEGFAEEIARAAGEGYAAGAFRLRIAGRHPLLPLLAWGANLRTRWLAIALGDQGLFVQRELFRRLGGFPDLPLMEDYAFTRRLRAEGISLFLARSAVETSGRRWDEEGFFRVWWRMRRNYWRFRWSGEAAELARGYRDVR